LKTNLTQFDIIMLPFESPSMWYQNYYNSVMDALKSIVLVSPADLPRVDALVTARVMDVVISPDKARKGVIYPLKTGIYALVGITERTFTR